MVCTPSAGVGHGCFLVGGLVPPVLRRTDMPDQVRQAGSGQLRPRGRRISRRAVLVSLLGSSAALGLAACTPTAPPAAQKPEAAAKPGEAPKATLPPAA